MEAKGDDAKVTTQEPEIKEDEKLKVPPTPGPGPAKIPKEKKRRPKNGGPNNPNRQKNENCKYRTLIPCTATKLSS